MSHRDHIEAGRFAPEMSFQEKVWAVAARIPRGRVATYGDLGRVIGGDGFRGFRAVGHALGRNPHAPRVPCHRVVGADGKLTGYAGGLSEKRRLLQAEGVLIVDGRVDLRRFGGGLSDAPISRT